MNLSKATLHWLNEFAAQGILTTDTDLAIRGWNHWLEIHSGMSADSLVGRSLCDVYPDLVTRRLDRFYRQALTGQVAVLSQRFHAHLFPFESEQGTPMQQSARIAPLTDDGRVVGTITMIEDVSERVRREEELRRQIAEQESLIAELDAYAHTVAHDLKNPLAVISGYASILTAQEDRVSPEQRRMCLLGIARGAQKMTTITSELLRLAEVRSGAAELMPLDMAEVVAEMRSRMSHLFDEYRPVITMPSTWPAAQGHAPWVEEVWANYLSNALKYGGRPPQIELGADPEGDGMVRFWIKDNGQGLSPQQQAQLFVEFTRVGQARVEGHGLGLSIVRRIVEKMGGKVGVQSDGLPGKGSLFFFTLPGVPAEDSA